MATQQVTLDIPDRVIISQKTDSTSFGQEMKMLAAVKLYELSRLSVGVAAELAGMSRVQFLSSLCRYQVFPLLTELHELEAQ
jgi:predicted HTH domain antitoxin